MRSYIRHPADIPIRIVTGQSQNETVHNQLSNVSQGGLAFNSVREIPPGAVIQVQIPVVVPAFEAQGIVTYCRAEHDSFVVGVEFIHRDDLYVARMVEQICHIEQYKQDVAVREGRQLSGQEAAREWIDKYAAHFPQWTN